MCKKLICTIPLSQMKVGKIKFQPKLPQEYIESFNKLGVGILNKVIVSF